MELEMPQEILKGSVFQKHKIYTKKNLEILFYHLH